MASELESLQLWEQNLLLLSMVYLSTWREAAGTLYSSKNLNISNHIFQLQFQFICDLFCSVSKVLKSWSYSRGKTVWSWLTDQLWIVSYVHFLCSPLLWLCLLSLMLSNRCRCIHISINTCSQSHKHWRMDIQKHTHTHTLIRFAFFN